MMSPLRPLYALARGPIIAMVAACTTPATSTVERTLFDDDETGMWNQQGSELLALPHLLEPLSVPTNGWIVGGMPATTVAVEGGALMVDGASVDLAGATFTASAPGIPAVAMRIEEVFPHHNPWNGPASVVHNEYIVEYQDGDGVWRGLCPDDHPGAMAIPGTFGIAASGSEAGPLSNGDYDPAGGVFTFSCREGVAAKCADWGYAPWSDDHEMVAYFQACTRMARADYCGNGHSRTVEGTLINYGDFRTPPVTVFSLRDNFVPEAVWGVGRGTAGTSAAICLSRTRWSTIPLGARSPCADLMSDPRTETAPQFCEDVPTEQWASAGALFINASLEIDVAVCVWTDGAGRYATTTRYPWLGWDVDAHGPPGYPQFVSIEGSTYKPTATPPPVPGLIPLFRYTKVAGDTLLTLTTTDPHPGGGFGDRVLEAYVFGPTPEPPVPTAQPLVLYKNDSGSFLTATDPKPPEGYTKVAKLGWLPH